MTIVLDTNVLIASFVTRGVCRDLVDHCIRRANAARKAELVGNAWNRLRVSKTPGCVLCQTRATTPGLPRVPLPAKCLSHVLHGALSVTPFNSCIRTETHTRSARSELRMCFNRPRLNVPPAHRLVLMFSRSGRERPAISRIM